MCISIWRQFSNNYTPKPSPMHVQATGFNGCLIVAGRLPSAVAFSTFTLAGGFWSHSLLERAKSCRGS